MPHLDPRSFPHIFDLIFDYTAPEDLVALREVCRVWERRYDAEFYHVRDFAVSCGPRSGRGSLAGAVTNPVTSYQFESGSGRRFHVSNLKLLAGCQVVDLRNIPTKLKIVADERFCIPVSTLRVSGFSYEYYGYAWGAIRGPRLVFDNCFAHGLWCDVRKLVINVRDFCFTMQTVGEHYDFGRLVVHEAVIILHSEATDSPVYVRRMCSECDTKLLN